MFFTTISRIPYFTRTPHLPNFRRFCSPTNNALNRYEALIKASDDEKIKEIAKRFLSPQEFKKFDAKFISVTSSSLKKRRQLKDLISKIQIDWGIIDLVGNEDYNAEHFDKLEVFIDVPYSKVVKDWPDRNAVQKLIREQFKSIFKSGDLVIIPGCADGQIPIEIYIQSIKHNKQLDIVAGDFNETAMQIGICTMEAYSLRPDRFQWVKADMTSEPFFDWIRSTYASHSSHRIVTLLQPCLAENSLLSLLENNRKLADQANSSTTVVMPVLLNDPDTEWHILHQNWANSETGGMKKNITRFGMEILKVDNGRERPHQYFINENSIDKIREEIGYKDNPNYPAEIIVSKDTKRKLCIWDYDPNSCKKS